MLVVMVLCNQMLVMISVEYVVEQVKVAIVQYFNGKIRNNFHLVMLPVDQSVILIIIFKLNFFFGLYITDMAIKFVLVISYS